MSIRILRPKRPSTARITLLNHAQLTAFGLVAVTAMIVFYALEARSPWYVLGFALSCWLGGLYGFLQGAWPFGIAETFWGFVAINKWFKSSRSVAMDAQRRRQS